MSILRQGWGILSTVILNIFALFIHFHFLCFSSPPSSFCSPFKYPFFLIGSDEDGDFITGSQWIIMWCNWPSSPIGGALLQLTQLEEALLAQVEAFVQLRSNFISVDQFVFVSEFPTDSYWSCSKMKFNGSSTDALELPIFIVSEN